MGPHLPHLSRHLSSTSAERDFHFTHLYSPSQHFLPQNQYKKSPFQIAIGSESFSEDPRALLKLPKAQTQGDGARVHSLSLLGCENLKGTEVASGYSATSGKTGREGWGYPVAETIQSRPLPVHLKSSDTRECTEFPAWRCSFIYTLLPCPIPQTTKVGLSRDLEDSSEQMFVMFQLSLT